MVFEAHETPLMALPVVVDSVDSLPEPIRAHYKPADGDLKGKYVLDAEEHPSGYRLENTKVLRSALEFERQDKHKLRERLSAYGDLTPDQIREMNSTIEALKSNVPADKVQAMVQAELGTHHKKWESEKAKLQAHSDRLRSIVETSLIDATAKQALLAEGAEPKHVDLLVRALRDIARVDIPEKGDPQVWLKNEADGRRSSMNGAGDMTIQEWVTSHAKKEYPALFTGGGATGGGRTGTGPGGGSGQFVLTEAEARDPARYRAVEDAAIKAGKQVSIVP